MSALVGDFQSKAHVTLLHWSRPPCRAFDLPDHAAPRIGVPGQPGINQVSVFPQQPIDTIELAEVSSSAVSATMMSRSVPPLQQL